MADPDQTYRVYAVKYARHERMVRLVERFVVLDHGRVLAEGLPQEIIKNTSVVEAYLGKKWVAK